MISKQEIKAALDSMSNIDVEIQALALEKQKKINEILTPEIKVLLDEIEVEFGPLEKAAQDNRARLEKFVRSSVIEISESVAGDALQAVFTDGKWSWDMKKVNAYLEEHPELADMRSKGDPYVTIRKIKQQEV